jgi:hypothetical protein
MWSLLNFGKHEGESLPEVVLRDPDWFFWAIDEKAIRSQVLAAEAQELDFKASNIKLPKPTMEHWRINYAFDRRSKFCGFTLIQVSSCRSIP